MVMPAKSSAQRGYGSKWQRARIDFLHDNPLCVMCMRDNKVTAANVVDHIVPHRGDMKLFWDRKNWQPLCKPHHDRDKQRLEKSGTVIGCDQSGMPLDKRHHWYSAQS